MWTVLGSLHPLIETTEQSSNGLLTVKSFTVSSIRLDSIFPILIPARHGVVDDVVSSVSEWGTIARNYIAFTPHTYDRTGTYSNQFHQIRVREQSWGIRFRYPSRSSGTNSGGGGSSSNETR